jgi:hypothetical protein
MAGKATSADPRHNGESEERPGLAEELALQKEEVLRLRDLLIARDAELGAARGRLAELEEGSLQLVNAAARLRSLVPRFIWTVVTKLRKSRR